MGLDWGLGGVMIAMYFVFFPALCHQPFPYQLWLRCILCSSLRCVTSLFPISYDCDVFCVLHCAVSPAFSLSVMIAMYFVFFTALCHQPFPYQLWLRCILCSSLRCVTSLFPISYDCDVFCVLHCAVSPAFSLSAMCSVPLSRWCWVALNTSVVCQYWKLQAIPQTKWLSRRQLTNYT